MASDGDRKRRSLLTYHEGQPAADRFEDTMRRVLTVSKTELEKREAAYQKSREHKDRPGPRRK